MPDRPPRRQIVRAVLDRHGRTYAAEAGMDLSRGTPSPLFRLLCLALLLSARIRADVAVAAARALSEAGWRTPRAMAEATWEERTRVLNRSGYARYDERTSRMLGDTATLLLDRYGGDLRKLRDQAERDPERERDLLLDFKGVGAVGARSSRGRSRPSGRRWIRSPTTEPSTSPTPSGSAGRSVRCARSSTTGRSSRGSSRGSCGAG